MDEQDWRDSNMDYRVTQLSRRLTKLENRNHDLHLRVKLLEGVPETPGDMNDILNKDLAEIGVGSKTAIKFSWHNINKVRDVVTLCDSDLMKFAGVGKKSVASVRRALRKHGLSLSMDISEFQCASPTSTTSVAN